MQHQLYLLQLQSDRDFYPIQSSMFLVQKDQIQPHRMNANKQLQTQTTDLQQYADSAQRQASQIDELAQRLESAQSKVQDFTVSQAKLETELSVKNDMIERLMAENRRQYDAPAT